MLARKLLNTSALGWKANSSVNHAFLHRKIPSFPQLTSNHIIRLYSQQNSKISEKIEENQDRIQRENQDILKSSKKKPNWRKRRDRAIKEFQRDSEGEYEQSGYLPDIIGSTYESTAYCTAEGYDINKLYQHLQQKNASVTITSAEDSSDSAVISRSYRDGEVFYFEGGSVVCWGLSQADIVAILQELKPFEQKPVQNIESESMDYAFTDSRTQLRNETIFINNELDAKESQQQKLAFSYGLHQSVKLAVLEDKVTNQIKSAKDIQEHLIKKSTWKSDNETKMTVNRMLSNLLAIRGALNLHSELLGTPDLFWEYPELEHFFLQMTKNLEISSRIAVVNKRLDESHLVLEMLKTELTTNHSSRLEMLIIYLIAIEVVLGLLKFV